MNSRDDKIPKWNTISLHSDKIPRHSKGTHCQRSSFAILFIILFFGNRSFSKSFLIRQLAGWPKVSKSQPCIWMVSMTLNGKVHRNQNFTYNSLPPGPYSSHPSHVKNSFTSSQVPKGLIPITASTQNPKTSSKSH